MNFIPSILGRVFGFLSGASERNPKTTNSVSAIAVLVSAWFGIDAGTFHSLGQAACAIGETLKKVPSF